MALNLGSASAHADPPKMILSKNPPPIVPISLMHGHLPSQRLKL